MFIRAYENECFYRGIVLVYVEATANLASDGDSAAWSFDIAHWGVAGHGATEGDAVANLLARVGRSAALGAEGGLGMSGAEIAERISGDEQAFVRDGMPHTPAELRETLRILDASRVQTLALARGASDAQLDWRDPERVLPSWATWNTPREVLWHIVDTESRYYLPALGLPALPRGTDIIDELQASALYVRRALETLPDAPIVHATERGQWTTVKLLRRLAWHERAELRGLRNLLGKAPVPEFGRGL